MAHNHYAPLDGDVVATGELTGPFRSCPACDHRRARIETKSSGFHPASLVCTSCGGHVSWLGRDHLAALLAQKKQADDERRAG